MYSDNGSSWTCSSSYLSLSLSLSLSLTHTHTHTQFFSSLARSKFLWMFMLSFIFTLCLNEPAKSRRQVLSLLMLNTTSGLLVGIGWICIINSKSHIILSISFYCWNSGIFSSVWRYMEQLLRDVQFLFRGSLFLDISKLSSSSSSSCRSASTDIPDPLSPLLPIIHRLCQVLWATSRILT